MSKRHHPQDDTESEAGPLARWSNRKARARDGEIRTPAGDHPVEEDDRDDRQPHKRDEDMPPVDTLDESSDVSGFFSPEVSEKLRNAALRKFFHSPAFNVVDGLDDYDDDFTGFTALGDIVTADMRHRSQLEKEAAQEAGDGQEAVAAADDPGTEETGKAEQTEQQDQADSVDAGTGDDGGTTGNSTDDVVQQRGEDLV